MSDPMPTSWEIIPNPAMRDAIGHYISQTSQRKEAKDTADKEVDDKMPTLPKVILENPIEKKDQIKLKIRLPPLKRIKKKEIKGKKRQSRFGKESDKVVDETVTNRGQSRRPDGNSVTIEGQTRSLQKSFMVVGEYIREFGEVKKRLIVLKEEGKGTTEK